jgi:hypothetical protein
LLTKLIKVTVILIVVSAASACTTDRTVQFDVPEGITVSIVDPSRPNATGEVIAKPYNIPAAKLDQKAIRFAGPGKVPQFWIFSSQQAESIRLAPALANAPFREGQQPKSNEDPQKEKEADKKVDLNSNVSHRLLMQSYRSLLANDLDVAQEAAISLEKLDPKLASPKIIKGLVALQKGENDVARSEFTTAKTLDPEDKEIDSLIELTQ